MRVNKYHVCVCWSLGKLTAQCEGVYDIVFGRFGIAACIQVTVPVNPSFWGWGVSWGRVSKCVQVVPGERGNGRLPKQVCS